MRTPFSPAAGAAAVTLTFPESLCPERLVFVVHDTGSDEWIRDHSANFSLPLRWGLFFGGGLGEGVLGRWGEPFGGGSRPLRWAWVGESGPMHVAL